MKYYAVESKPAEGDGKWTSCLGTKSEYDNLEEADEAFETKDDLWGHNYHHRLVEVKRKVLKER